MDVTQQAEKAAGCDNVGRSLVASCRECRVTMFGSAFGPCCPAGHAWAIHPAEAVKADPTLLKAAASFTLPYHGQRPDERAFEAAHAATITEDDGEI